VRFLIAYQADKMFDRPELHRMPHGAKFGASKHPGYEKKPNQPRLAGCVEAVFQAMVTHQKIGPLQGAGCWALAALATAIPVRINAYSTCTVQYIAADGRSLALKTPPRAVAAAAAASVHEAYTI
jgi:hypothetical protein